MRRTIRSVGRSAVVAVSVLLFGSAACAVSGCKKKQPEQVTKDKPPQKPTIAEVPAPPDCLLDMTLRDPEVTSKKLVDGAGLAKELGPSPYEKLLESISDENAKKAVRAIDPHGTIALVAVGKVDLGFKPHAVIAFKLKDPDLAGGLLSAAAKTDGAKVQKSEKLGIDIHDLGGGARVGIYGDVVLASDDKDALESAGKYVAFRATGAKVDHDISLRLPLDLQGAALKKLGAEAWSKVKPGDVGGAKLKTELDAVIAGTLDAVADAGSFIIDLDVKGDNLVIDEKLGAKAGGALATWFSKYPTGDAAPMLSMPRADGVAIYRMPSGLTPLLFELADAGLAGSSLSPAEKTDTGKHVRALGAALGHTVTMSSKNAAAAGSLKGSEYLLRVDLDDAAAVKTAIAGLRKVLDKLMGSKPTSVAYKKFGAEGETFTVPGSTPGLSMFGGGGGLTTDTLFYAQKDKALYVGLCFDCPVTLPDLALDPASKGLLEGDAEAKKKLGELPGKGLLGASYGNASFLPFMGGGGGSKPTGVAWGYTVVGPDGLVAKGAMPLVSIGDGLRGYLAMVLPPPTF